MVYKYGYKKIKKDNCPICGPGNYTDWGAHVEAFHYGCDPCKEVEKND